MGVDGGFFGRLLYCPTDMGNRTRKLDRENDSVSVPKTACHRLVEESDRIGLTDDDHGSGRIANRARTLLRGCRQEHLRQRRRHHDQVRPV